jgi:acetolactate synthase-1/2/3 large subunit
MGIDHQALFRPLTKQTTRLSSDAARSILFDSARLALSERPGPVHVGLPIGLSAEAVPQEQTAFTLPPATPAPAAAEIDRAVSAFEKSSRTVVAVGLGAVRASVQDQIRHLAEKHGIPVVLTPMAKGMLPEEHSCYAGVLFHALSDIVGKTHREADLVLAVGYDPVEFNYESWLPTASLVSIDTVPADIDRNAWPEVIDVVGAIPDSLSAVLDSGPRRSAWRLQEIADRKAGMFARLAPSGTFGPKAALAVLRDVLPVDGIMTCDVGAHTHLIGQAWRTPEPGLQIMTNGWSAMGFGIPSAIAAKLVHPRKSVCAVVGDGGFLMTAGEIATAVRCQLNIVILLLTDNDLALIRIKQERKGNPVYGTMVRETGTIGGSNIFGAPVYVAKDAATLRRHLDTAFANPGPVIVEAIVDSREYDSLVLKKDRA